MLPRTTDVLICGSGSAGLCAAAWLARCGLRCTILESSPSALEIGKADGVQCRTVEVYESFALSDAVLRESYHVNEVAFWAATAENGIVRTSRTADTPTGLSHMPHVILNQARMNGLLIEAMKRWSGQGIDYGWTVTGVQVEDAEEDNSEAYPVIVTAERDGIAQTIRAKYVLVRSAPYGIGERSANDTRAVTAPTAQYASRSAST
jgi:phenol 2-monooxygenase